MKKLHIVSKNVDPEATTRCYKKKIDALGYQNALNSHMKFYERGLLNIRK